jgi:hypothetical protein
MLNAGANDVGGTLMEETISRMAGSEHGSAKTVESSATSTLGSDVRCVSASPSTTALLVAFPDAVMTGVDTSRGPKRPRLGRQPERLPRAKTLGVDERPLADPAGARR